MDCLKKKRYFACAAFIFTWNLEEEMKTLRKKIIGLFLIRLLHLDEQENRVKISKRVGEMKE